MTLTIDIELLFSERLTGIINMSSPLTLTHILTSVGEVQIRSEEKNQKEFEERRKWISIKSRGWLLL
jgi:hypothetical protein